LQPEQEAPLLQIPTKVEELDQDYFKFVDMRVYTQIEELDDENYPTGRMLTVIDVDATHARITAAKERAAKRRAKRQGRAIVEHVGFNRADRRKFMKKLSKRERRVLAEHVAREASKSKVDKPNDPVV